MLAIAKIICDRVRPLDERRGITEMNGEGEVVSGIALQRFGENALAVIRNVKDRLAEIAPSLPAGVKRVSRPQALRFF
jgi:Cu/Ag efflux pump CusA